MREIKFRVWNTETNKMIINVKEMGVFALQSIYSIDEFLVIPTNEKYPLMQYTGLKDKNGVEIYEGDILSHHLQGNRFVEYGSPFKNYGGYMLVSKNGMRGTLSDPDKLYEVIGNIYENPELLKAL